MVEMPPEVLAVILMIALGYFLAGAIIDGTKHVAHKAKCGIERIVGKHCEPDHVDIDENGE